MPDDVARAVGASSDKTIIIADKELAARPISIKGLTEIERDCLTRYKRSYLETFFDNADLLPANKRDAIIEKKLDEVGRWDIDSLPPRYAHDPTRVRLTDALKSWLKSMWTLPDDIDEFRQQLLTVASLDQATLSEDKYKELTGGPVPKVKVPYVHWWITGSFDGMITLVWTCFKYAGVTRDQVSDALGNNLVALNEMAREIERLSAPQAGNG